MRRLWSTFFEPKTPPLPAQSSSEVIAQGPQVLDASSERASASPKPQSAPASFLGLRDKVLYRLRARIMPREDWDFLQGAVSRYLKDHPERKIEQKEYLASTVERLSDVCTDEWLAKALRYDERGG